MTKETNTPANKNSDTLRDISGLLATIPLAMAASGREATAAARADTAAMAVHDAAVATFGTARVLVATSRDKDATPEEALAYIACKEAAVAAAWSPAFLAKVNNGGDTKETIGAPKKGLAPNTRGYWQQQKGTIFGRIVKRIVKVQKASDDVVHGSENTDKSTKGANQKATIDERAIASVGVPMKAFTKAMDTTNGKGEKIPGHCDAHAFIQLCELALLALSKNKVKQEQSRIALRAYAAATKAAK